MVPARSISVFMYYRWICKQIKKISLCSVLNCLLFSYFVSLLWYNINLCFTLIKSVKYVYNLKPASHVLKWGMSLGIVIVELFSIHWVNQIQPQNFATNCVWGKTTFIITTKYWISFFHFSTFDLHDLQCADNSLINKRGELSSSRRQEAMWPDG